MPNLSNLSQQQKIQWLKSQGVSDEAINQRLGNTNTSTQKQEPEKQGLLETAVRNEWLPKALSSAGAFTGGLLGAGSGALTGGTTSIPGAVLGAGFGGSAGYAGGRAINEIVQDLLGYQDETPFQQVTSAAKGTATTGATSAAGELVGQGLGALLSKVGSKIFNFGLRKPSNVATKEFLESAGNRAAGKGGYQLSEEMIQRGVAGKPEDWFNIAKAGKNKSYQTALNLASDYSKAPEELVQYGVQTAGKNTVMNVEEELFKPLMEQLYETPPGFIEDAVPAYKKVYNEIIKRYGKDLSVEDLVHLNKQINSKLWTAASNPSTSQTATSEAYRALDSVIKPYLQQNYPDIAEQLSEYGLYSSIEQISKYTGKVNTSPTVNPLMLINKFLKNPQATTYGGSALYNSNPQYLTTPLGAYLGSDSKQ